MHPVQTLFEELIQSDSVFSEAWQTAISTEPEQGYEGFSDLEVALTEVVQSFVYDTWEMLQEEGVEVGSSADCQSQLRRCLVLRRTHETFTAREQKIVAEMMNLAFARIHRLVRAEQGNENPSFDEDVLLFSDEVLFYTATFCYLRTVKNYLQTARQMVTLPEGRSSLDLLFERLNKITDLLNIVRMSLRPNQELAFYEKRVQRVVEEYFAKYAVEMRVNPEAMNWGFLRGLLERLHQFNRKSVNRVNRIAVAYHALSLARIVETALSAIPAGDNSEYKFVERLAYEKMIRDLLFLKNSALGDEMSLSHVEV